MISSQWDFLGRYYDIKTPWYNLDLCQHCPAIACICPIVERKCFKVPWLSFLLCPSSLESWLITQRAPWWIIHEQTGSRNVGTWNETYHIYLTAGHSVILAASVFNPNCHLMKYQASLCPACSCTGSTWEVVELWHVAAEVCMLNWEIKTDKLPPKEFTGFTVYLFECPCRDHVYLPIFNHKGVEKNQQKRSKKNLPYKTTQKDIQPSELRHVCWHCFLCLLYWPYWPCSG